ncbi:insulinase family protein [Candidatus Woesearchaeota archaeon]|jgi:zinc protease|nr:insulinase family protein [Candidatus Woesearchaeota archaeon]MBT4387476.1 insulinase family protein [Candidatus Woesearchaeota archaeon]MBT4595874.1 insulinase family protein [Candidatus Woesearchaeota archaeon]MBT5741277.1 insulinase family protein [Candidatus Woesearchaeota archaeon]MBT6505962.1 insulinase family protein [Candidatus Woesearchaeota archaeon]
MKYNSFKLSNGLEIYFIKQKSSIISAEIDVNWAPRDEPKGKEGISHFLEHIIWNSGSVKLDSKKVKEIKRKFGMSNAATAKDRTYYFAQFFKNRFELFLELISELVLNNNFETEIIKKEKERVLREISDKTGNVEYKDINNFRKKFLFNTIHNRRPLGYYDSVVNIDRKDLIEYYKKGYVINNMKLILVGELPSNFKTLVKKYFDKFKSKKVIHKKFEKISLMKKKMISHVSAKELLNKNNIKNSSAHMIIEFFAPELFHKDFAAMDIANTIIGGPNSKLHNKISRDEGLAYSIYSHYICRFGIGHIIINTKVNADKIKKAQKLIFDVINNFEKDLKQLDIDFAKESLIFRKFKSMDSGYGALMSISESLSSGLSYENYLKLIKKVTIEDVKKVVKKYLTKNHAILIRDPLK